MKPTPYFSIFLVSLIATFAGCAQKETQTPIVMTPLQRAKTDYWAYQKKMSELHRSLEKQGALKIEEGAEIPPSVVRKQSDLLMKHLGISEELERLLHGIYFREYKEKFGDITGLSVSTPPLLIAYLRIRYTFPDFSEPALREFYRASIKQGEVHAVIGGEKWPWIPKNDRLETEK